MGCDIHMFVEVKQKDNDWWQSFDAIFPYPYYHPENAPTRYNKQFTDEPYNDRNYDLFSALAGVRNGYAFAGCDTGDAIKPIQDPRGLPDNVSDEVKKESDE